MFRLDDEEEEKRRKRWYAPIGESIVLFSNLEFCTREWVKFLIEDAEKVEKVSNKWSFKRRAEDILKAIAEFDDVSKTKKDWTILWKEAIDLYENRNIIAHNPPLNNFDMTWDENKGKIEITEKVEEIFWLDKPVGAPGSGLSLEYLINQNRKLRSIIIRLDREMDHEAACEMLRH